MPFRAVPAPALGRRTAALFVFPATIATLLVLVAAALSVLGAVRAYVAGESAWSRAQKSAVVALYEFARTGDPSSWRRFERSLEIPAADERARRRLADRDTDVDAVARDFVLGGSDPADARAMVLLVEWLPNVSYVRRAMRVWAHGDSAIAELRHEGAIIRAAVSHGVRGDDPGDDPGVRAALARVAAIDARVSKEEAAFADAFGDAARAIQRGVLLVAVLAGVLLTALGMFATSRMFRHARAAADATRRRAEEFGALVEQSPDLVVQFDRELKPAYANPAASAADGPAFAELLGVGPGGAEVRAALERAAEHDERSEVHLELPGRTGARTVHCRVVPLRGVDGRAERVLLVARDVTELLRSQRLLREREAQLRQAQKMEAIALLAGGVAHDFNNLLTVIGANADVLLEGQPPSSEERRALLEVRRAAARAGGLTRQLLAFSRQQVLQPRLVSLSEAVASTTSMLAGVLGERVRLVTELEPALAATHVDPGQLEQVLVNLVVHARDAMPNGGDVRIRTRHARLDDGRVFEDEAGEHVMLEVRDTGAGMTPEEQARVFEPFFETREAGRGSGLGLATVFGIVTQSGGVVQVESPPEGGAVFRILFPRSAAPAPVRSTLTPVPDATPARGGSETILLVEDEEGVRRLAARVLGRLGYTVLEAPDGAAALEMASASDGAFDLVLTDVVMPRLGGPELARALGARGLRRPIAFMSGYAQDLDGLRDALAGGAAFLSKPFTVRQLADVVRGALDECEKRETKNETGAGTPTLGAGWASATA